MQNALILPILTIFLISGCASTKQLEIFKTEVERVPLDLQYPPVEVLEEINWLIINEANQEEVFNNCLLYTSPSPRDGLLSRMPSSA